jgi:hypothetical protein
MPQQNLDLGQQVQHGFDSFINEQLPGIIDYNKQIYPAVNDALYRGAEYSAGELEKTYNKVLDFLKQFQQPQQSFKLSAQQNAVIDPATGQVTYTDQMPAGMQMVDPQQVAAAELGRLPQQLAGMLPYAGGAPDWYRNPTTYNPNTPGFVYGGEGSIDPRMEVQPGLSYYQQPERGPEYAPSGWQTYPDDPIQRYGSYSQPEYFEQAGLGGVYSGQPYQAYGPQGYGYNPSYGYQYGNGPGYGLVANAPGNQYADIPYYAQPGQSNYSTSDYQPSNYVTSGSYA